jgi:hypothetical protein
MYRLIITLLLLSVQFCMAQEPAEFATAEKKKIILKWTPTSLLGYYPAIQFAAEFYYRPSRSLQVEYGWIAAFLNYSGVDNEGHRIRIEHRNYFSKNSKWYVAPELHFQYYHYTKTMEFATFAYDPVKQKNVVTEMNDETAGISKAVGAANLKIGWQHTPAAVKKFTVNLYLGAGMRVRSSWLTTSHSGVPFPTSGLYRYGPNYGRGGYAINPAGGIQICYRIR